MHTPTTNKIDALKAKRTALDDRIQRLQQRDKAVSRKTRSRVLILLGSIMEQQIVNALDTDRTKQMIMRYLKNLRDQEVVLNYFHPNEPASGEGGENP